MRIFDIEFTILWQSCVDVVQWHNSTERRMLDHSSDSSALSSFRVVDLHFAYQRGFPIYLTYILHMIHAIQPAKKASKIPYSECHLSQSSSNNSSATFDFKLNNIFVCLFMYRSINFLSLVRALARSHQYFIQTLHQTNTIKYTQTHISRLQMCLTNTQRPKIVSISTKLKFQHIWTMDSRTEREREKEFCMKLFFTCIKY